MDDFFALNNRKGIDVLTVYNLLNEIANRDMMLAVETRIADGISNFIVDLSEIDYMNSVGINFLIKMKHRAKECGGGLAIANASPRVQQLLEVTKLRPMFHLADSVDEALKFLAG